jgi:hypothetical protein
MRQSVPRRLRAPVILAAVSAAVLVVGGATHGWSGVAYVLPIPIVLVAAFFALGKRDTDTGALLRRELDERQANERLEVQALVGRALSIAVAVAFTIAWATGTMLWPWGAMLGVMAVAFVGGRLVYADHGSPHGDPEVN